MVALWGCGGFEESRQRFRHAYKSDGPLQSRTEVGDLLSRSGGRTRSG